MIFEPEVVRTVRAETKEEFYITQRFSLKGRNFKAKGKEIQVKVSPMPKSCQECPFWYQPEPGDEGTCEEHWTCFLRLPEDYTGVYEHRASGCPLETETLGEKL